jgi:hypothetical protein
VPIAQMLRHLQPGPADDLAFDRTPQKPFDPSTVSDRAARVRQAADLEPITLHECSHTFASILIAAGVNPKAVQTYMGHASITVTPDLYGHLLPGSEVEVRNLLDAYLDRSLKGTPWGTRGDRGAVLGGFRRPPAGSRRCDSSTSETVASAVRRPIGLHGAAMESNHPTAGLPRPAGFEDATDGRWIWQPRRI